MTYREAIYYTLDSLKTISNKEKETDWILEFILRKSKSEIIHQLDLFLTHTEQEKLVHLVERRKEHYPLQYLLGSVEFMGYSFITCPNVLIPREDTAVLVEYILQYAKRDARILEIGVGSGIISLTLKKKREDFTILATDINKDALECTRKNEERLFGSCNNIILEHKDLLTDINSKWDIIVSNPPYLTEEELLYSDQELNYEPQNALMAPEKGLFFYKKILKQGLDLINPGGFFIFEISPLRKEGVLSVITEYKLHFKILTDLAGMERAIVIWV